MKNRFHLSHVAFAATALISLLGGCAAPESLVDTSKANIQNRSAVTQVATPVEAAAVSASTPGTSTAALQSAKPTPVARWSSKPWFGARMADVQNDEVLPPVFYEQRTVNFDDKATAGRVSISVFAERLSRITGIPVRVKADVYGAARQGVGMTSANRVPPATAPGRPVSIVPTGAAPAGASSVVIPSVSGASTMPAQVMTPEEIPAPVYQQPLTDVSSVEMRWQGTLAGLLDHVTARLGLSWSYRDGTVVIERFVTETFELSAFAGTQEFKMSLASGNSGQSSSSGVGGGTSASAVSNLDLTETGKVQVLESIKKAVEAVVRDSGGSVVLNEGTGRLFVSAPRDVMGRVRSIVKSEEATLRRQAHIQFDIYSVTNSTANEAGVDWDMVFKNLAGLWGATVSSPSTLTGGTVGTVGVSILSSGTSDTARRFGDSKVFLNLLHGVGETAQYKPYTAVAMNRQWARLTNLLTDGYVNETTPSTSSAAGSGAPGLKTASITTGDKFMVQPAIMDNGTIILKFGVSLTELLQMLTVTAGSGTTLQTVQTPVTSGTDNQATLRLQPGQAMVVTGLSRRYSSAERRTLTPGAPMVLGGSRAIADKREDFVLVVRVAPIN